LAGWLDFATTNPDAFDLEASNLALLAYRGEISFSLIALCAAGVIGKTKPVASIDFETVSRGFIPALEACTRFKLAAKERLTPDKQLRFLVQSWQKLLVCNEEVPFLKAMAWQHVNWETMASDFFECGLSALCKQRDVAESLLHGIRRGVSCWVHDTDTEPFGCPTCLRTQIYDSLESTAGECCDFLGAQAAIAILVQHDDGTRKPHQLNDCAQDVALLYRLVTDALPTPPEDHSNVLAWFGMDSQWPEFVTWAAAQVKRSAALGLDGCLQPIKQIAKQVAVALENFTATLEDGSVTISSLRVAEAQQGRLLRPLTLIGLLQRFQTACKSRSSEVSELCADITALQHACGSRFAPEEACNRSISVALMELHRFTLQEIRAFLGIGALEEAHPDLAPLPPLLLKATAWLAAHASSALFGLVWADAAATFAHVEVGRV